MKKSITTGLIAVGSLAGFVACSADPSTDSDGAQLSPQQSNTEAEIEIQKVYESSLECKLEICFEIESQFPLDYVGIDANVEAGAMQFFELDQHGKKHALSSAIETAADLSLHAGFCKGLPEDCLGTGKLGKTHVMACISIDTSLGADDIDVYASAGGKCQSTSFDLSVSAECSGSIEIPDCGDKCGGSGGSGGSGGAAGSGGSSGSGPHCDGGLQLCDGMCVDCKIDLDHCGACGKKCDGKCVAGICLPKCDLGKVLCGDLCVDLDIDLLHCGACGNICELGKCLLGKCML